MARNRFSRVLTDISAGHGRDRSTGFGHVRSMHVLVPDRDTEGVNAPDRTRAQDRDGWTPGGAER